MKPSFKTLFQVFWSFFKIGAFTFGGGLAMIPLIQREAVEKQGWVTDEDILEIVAIAESTPGPISINAATFVGYRAGGILGSAAATFGTVLPSFVIIYAISFVLRQFQQLPAVQYAFWGIRAGVMAMLLKAAVTMFQKNAKGLVPYIAMAAAFVLSVFFDVHILIIIGCCAAFGLITATVQKKKEEKK